MVFQAFLYFLVFFLSLLFHVLLAFLDKHVIKVSMKASHPPSSKARYDSSSLNTNLFCLVEDFILQHIQKLWVKLALLLITHSDSYNGKIGVWLIVFALCQAAFHVTYRSLSRFRSLSAFLCVFITVY